MALVSMETIQDVCNQIVERFEPDKVILFGSYANGNQTRDSDVDLLVILDFQGRNVEKAFEIRQTVEFPFPCDILAKTPADAERRYREFDPIMRSAFNHGKVLYDRNTQRVA